MKSWIFLCMFLVHSFAIAQNYVDVAHFRVGTSSSNNFDTNFVSSKIDNYHFDLSTPVLLSNKRALLLGLNLDKSTLKLDINSDKMSLYLTGLEIGLFQKIKDKSAFTVLFRPQFTSDSKKLNSKDLKLGIFTLVTYKKGTNLTYRYGLYYKDEYYGPLVVPLVGFYYLNERKTWEFDVMAPVNIRIDHHPTTNLSFGIKFDGLGTTYKLKNGFNSVGHAYIEKKSNELFATIQYKVLKNLLFNVEIGHSFFRSYKVYKSNDGVDLSLASIYFNDKRIALNNVFEDGLLFRTGLTYRLPIN